MISIASEIWNAPVAGLNLRAGGLVDQFPADRAGLLVFLRHLGCPFCKETVADLRKLQGGGFPPVVFVSQCGAAETRTFFADRWAEAAVVCDPEKSLYSAFGLRRGSLGQMIGLRVWTCSLRALTKGHMMTIPVGDPWLMPGVFIVRGNRVVWQHEFRHQGDLPDWKEMPGRIAGIEAGQASAVR